MSDLNDDRNRQDDEVAAMSAIYEDDWCIIDDVERIYGVVIRHENTSLNLQVKFPDDYPSMSPPTYELHAPWLRGEQRQELCARLDDVYLYLNSLCDIMKICLDVLLRWWKTNPPRWTIILRTFAGFLFRQHLGESLVYLWVENATEFLVSLANLSAPSISPLSSEISQFEEAFDIETDMLDPPTQEWECPPIIHGETVTRKASSFQAHVAAVHSKEQVTLVLEKLKESKKVAHASHNILAYRIASPDSAVVIQGCDDDGETHAGSRLLHLLQIVGGENVMVVVSRWFGGILMGPERFKVINNCARDLLQEAGYVNEKGDKKGPKTKLK